MLTHIHSDESRSVLPQIFFIAICVMLSGLIVVDCFANEKPANASIPAYRQMRLSSILLKSTDASGIEQHAIHMQKLDEILGILHAHAASYPTRFASDDDRDQARGDAEKLSEFFDVTVTTDSDDAGMLLRAAMLNAMGHHLDVKGCAKKANAFFERLVELKPDTANVHQQYGFFLGSSGQSKKAIVHLTMARELGAPVTVSLAMAHFAAGNRREAIRLLTVQVSQNPSDRQATSLLAAIQSNRAFVKSK
ncbi:MAG: hypothetical protein WBD20_14040 [Pirellulaceae bacterium]